MLVEIATPPVHYGQILLSRLVGAKLLPEDHQIKVPELPDHLVPGTFDLEPPTPDDPMLHLPPFLVVPVPSLKQVHQNKSSDVICRWLPATGHTEPYWVAGTVMVMGRSFLPVGEELKGCHIGYGEAACLIAQFPELGCCRTRQSTYPVLQARRSRRLRRIILDDATNAGNDMFHFVTFLRSGARIGHVSAVLSVRVAA